MKYFINILIITLFFYAEDISSQEILLDNFENDNLSDWNIYKSDAVDIEISSAEGLKGKGIKLDYNFTTGAGYGGIQKIVPLDLPENFQFIFYLKAESPSNNFEFKLLDNSGGNVWWVNNRNYNFPSEWTKIKIKKRHINFAWGPIEDKALKKIDRLEFTIASYVGGKGTVYIDELKFEELPPEDNSTIIPVVLVSSEFEPKAHQPSAENENFSVKNINDNNPETEWRSNENESQEIILDLKKRREIGGLVINWNKENFAEEFDIYTTIDDKEWNKIYSVRNSKGNKNFIRLIEEDALKIKIDLLKSSRSKGFGIKEISVKNVDYSEDVNKFFINIAKDFPRGYFPRYFNEEASFWTVVGVNNDVKEALINEDGMVEVDKQKFSIEPFLYIDDKLITWNDVEKNQTLEKNILPIPTINWNYKNLLLETKVFASGDANKNSTLYLIYKLTNNSSERKKGNLYLAIRPFQVNPYYQWLNITGGVSEISSIRYLQGRIFVNDDKIIVPVTKADNFGAASFDEGDITVFLADNNLPGSMSLTDERGLVSSALNYSFDLRQGEEKIIYLAVPFYNTELPVFKKPSIQTLTEKHVKDFLTEIINFWDEKINYVRFNLPSSADKLINSYKSNLAYILINRDNAGIQPGSRSYERSWIRDGSLTSSALLKSGIVKEVKEFIEWYAPYQFENGKVPCVVDTRGPDPVPENDSHGQLIFLIKEYFNFTKDTAFLAEYNKYVINAVNYMQELIAERSTDHFKFGNDSVRAYYGILPESISHEGYSEKPMHSYWDNFFAMKGLKDAVNIQKIIGNQNEYERIAAVRDKFKIDLYNSIQLAMKTRNIDYIPGCVELGDFDATSTTIALYPVNEFPNLPQPELENTFEKYYKYFTDRRDGKIEWTAYTPYEVRTIGSFIFLDKPEIAHELIEFFMNDRKPQGWNHWAEVVWNNDRYPAFIGDMPHTWVGSDFINAMRALFVYENEYDSSLVIGAGLYQNWIDTEDGMSVENLPTFYGELSYSIKKETGVNLRGYETDDEALTSKVCAVYKLKLFGDIQIPSGGIILKNFNSKKLPAGVKINGNISKNFTENAIVIENIPADVEIIY